jgi:hypothetical protein
MTIALQDFLRDVVQHTLTLGGIDTIRVSGTDAETEVDTVSADNSVIVKAKLREAMPEFTGAVGFPNLAKLNTILNISEYRDGATVSIVTETRNGVAEPAGVRFVNQSGDFRNEYRLMSTSVINEKLKTVEFKRTPNWTISFSPAATSIQRLKFQASANSDESCFTAEVDGSDLKFYFGQVSSHAGDFVFQTGVSGSVKRTWRWPVAQIISILSLPGDKIMKFSDTNGCAQIVVDSGVAVYAYTIPALTK